MILTGLSRWVWQNSSTPEAKVALKRACLTSGWSHDAYICATWSLKPSVPSSNSLSASSRISHSTLQPDKKDSSFSAYSITRKLTCAAEWQVVVGIACAPVYWGLSPRCLKTIRIKFYFAIYLMSHQIAVKIANQMYWRLPWLW